MIFKLISSGRLEVVLTAQEICSAGIDPESESPAEIKRLKRYLLSLLAQAQSRLEQPFLTGEQLLIEIHPQPDGSANIFFISEEAVFHRICEPTAFGFSSSEQLISAAITLFKQYSHRLFKSSLYSLRGEWLLIISPIESESDPAALLAEFDAKDYGKTLIPAIIAEHCEPIIAESAVDTLSRYFE